MKEELCSQEMENVARVTQRLDLDSGELLLLWLAASTPFSPLVTAYCLQKGASMNKTISEVNKIDFLYSYSSSLISPLWGGVTTFAISSSLAPYIPEVSISTWFAAALSVSAALPAGIAAYGVAVVAACMLRGSNATNMSYANAALLLSSTMLFISSINDVCGIMLGDTFSSFTLYTAVTAVSTIYLANYVRCGGNMVEVNAR